MHSSTPLLARDLTELLARELPGPLTVLDLRRVTGGTSRETWSFDVLDGEGARHSLILRRELRDGRTQHPGEPVSRTQDPAEPVGRTQDPGEPIGHTRHPAEPIGNTRHPAEPVSHTRHPNEPVSHTRHPNEPIGHTQHPGEPVSRHPGEPVSRTQKPDEPLGRNDALNLADEFALLRYLHAVDIPVPRPLTASRPGDVLDCSVMERVDGETRPWVLTRGGAFEELRPRLVRQLAAALARVHSRTAAELPLLPQRPLAGQLDRVRDLLDAGGPPRPALEAGLRWCRDRLPTIGPRPMRLVHGDFRTGNYAVGPDGLRALFSWKYAHIGDPVIDLGHACLRAWRFGAEDRECAGIGSRADFLAAYQAAGGTRVDERLVHYSEVLNTLMTAGLFLGRAQGFRSGVDRTVESAAAGRRIAEIEYDLLALLDRKP
ncbi:phosphotransferase [Nocardia sp. NPDC051832]|uniref:phosphotransferase family protein n=1 Tax=Nocardia sp. NPDC051832 TaxID=3155673 RepID=UPI00341EC470